MISSLFLFLFFVVVVFEQLNIEFIKSLLFYWARYNIDFRHEKKIVKLFLDYSRGDKESYKIWKVLLLLFFLIEKWINFFFY